MFFIGTQCILCWCRR